MNSKSTQSPETPLQRLGLEGIFDRLRSLEAPADAVSWRRFTGALLLVLIVLLFLSGALMAFYYSPAPGAAYDSVDFALFTLPFGGILHGVHHYAWNLLLMVMVLHLLRGVVLGAYKAPRQLTWVSGVLLLLVFPLFIITGDLLPWDQKGFWSTQVRLSIIGTVPLVGDLAVRLLQGGPLTGIVALTRFYVLHVIFLPSLVLGLVAVHLHFIRHRGLSGPVFTNRDPGKKIRFFPTVINRWLLLFILAALALGAVSWYWPAPFGDPADPTDASFVPRPEWWVLFLNQLLTVFKGPLTIVGSVIIPGALVGLLMALPVLDRSRERHPAYRWKVLVTGALVTLLILSLSVMGYLEHFGPSSH